MEGNLIKINKWLYPVSWLYGTGVWLRNKLFDWGIYKERKFDVPIISVGNITVGGTGKTPHTEYLIRLLQKDYKVAVLSRGYKRKSKGFVLAGPDTSVQMIGDEPFQMKQKFPDIYMAVDRNRCHGIEQLCNSHIAPGTEVIILDDAFQHRYVKPGMNILLVDYHRLICEDALLPAGRMREPENGKSRAHIVIVTKCPKDITPMDLRVLSKQMELYPYQQLYFTTLAYGKLHPLFTVGNAVPLKEIEKENYAEDVEKSHSKIITRKYYMTSKISWLENKEKWEKLKSIEVEKKTIESIQTGEVTEENRYFIISFKDDIHSFADAVRKHWGVENNLHAPLDIVFKEDANRTLEKNGARNLGILKRICLAVLKFVQTYYNLSLNKIRFLLSIDFEKEIENVFKLLNTNDIKKLLEKNA